MISIDESSIKKYSQQKKISIMNDRNKFTKFGKRKAKNRIKINLDQYQSKRDLRMFSSMVNFN